MAASLPTIIFALSLLAAAAPDEEEPAPRGEAKTEVPDAPALVKPGPRKKPCVGLACGAEDLAMQKFLAKRGFSTLEDYMAWKAEANRLLTTPGNNEPNFNELTNNPRLTEPGAVEALRTMQEREPQSASVNALVGAQALRQGEFAGAHAALTTAIRGAPRDAPPNPDLYYLRGAAALNLGKPEEALEDLLRAVELKPELTQAQDLIKLAQKRVPDRKIPLPSDEMRFEQNSELVGGGGRGGYRAAGASAGGAAAAPSYAPVPRAVAEQSARLTAEGEGRRRVGDSKGALGALDKAIQINPSDAKARHVRTEILLRQGDYAGAEKEATEVLKLVAGHPGALNMRALARSRQGDYAAALEDAKAALAAKADSAMGFYNLAYALAGMGRRAEAVAALEKAAAVDSAFSATLRRLQALPEDADASLVFAAEEGGARPAESAAAAEPKRASRGLLFGLAAVGGGLAATALFLGLRRREDAPAAAGGEAEDAAFAAIPRGSSDTLGPGVVLGGNYRVEGELGRGSMGVVVRAVDLTLKRPVAIKMLRQYARGRAESVEQLLREAQTVAALKHPNIVQIHAALRDGEDILLVFEHVSGRPLSAVLADFGHLPLADAKPIVRDIAAALDYAHARSVIHRDLKPGNVMIDGDGRASVMDFGIAHRMRGAAGGLTQAGTWGSPAYMAPEQEAGSVCAASDVYALGVCLYEMLTGRLPFDGDEPGGQKRSASFVPASTLRPSLPPEADAVFARAFRTDPAARFASAGEFSAAVDVLLERS